jgi:hypothetical protein
MPLPLPLPWPRVHHVVSRLGHTAGIALLAAIVVACQSGLTSGEWVWCKANLTAVDTAAGSIGLAKANLTYQEPSWYADYLTGNLNSSLAWAAESSAFQNACAAAADQRGVVGDGRVPWCLEDGFGETWGASIDQGNVVELTAATFSYKALPLQQRLENPDFVAACRAAFAAR